MELVAGVVAFVVLFAMFVILPSRLQAPSEDEE